MVSQAAAVEGSLPFSGAIPHPADAPWKERQGAAISCPRCGHANDTVALLCASESCDQKLTAWPSWFASRFNRLLFVNGVRTLALVVAVAIALFQFAWPVFAYTTLLFFLFQAIVLREHSHARRWTTAWGAGLFGTVALTHFTRLLELTPVTAGALYGFAVPGLLAVLLLVSTLIYRSRGRVGYFPFFPAMLLLLTVTYVLQWFAARQGVEPISTAMALVRPYLFGTLTTGIVVGGLIAGVAKTLPAMAPTSLGELRISSWRPRRPVFMPASYSASKELRSLMRSLERAAYLASVALHSLAVGTVNSTRWAVVNVANRALTLLSTAITLLRRFARRLYAVAIETVMVAVDGVVAALNILAPFARFTALPMGAILYAAFSAAALSVAVTQYVWSGDLRLVATAASSMLILLLATIVLVACLTPVTAIRAVRSIAAGLVEPAIYAVVLFLLLSITLSFSSAFLRPNPYRIGPLTLASGVLVIGVVAFMFVQMRRAATSPGASAEEDERRIEPVGAVVRIAPVVWTFALVTGMLIVVSLPPVSATISRALELRGLVGT